MRVGVGLRCIMKLLHKQPIRSLRSLEASFLLLQTVTVACRGTMTETLQYSHSWTFRHAKEHRLYSTCAKLDTHTFS